MSSQLGGCLAGEPENVQCPRCSSTNTKFCYYNNYNHSQPRYFCKSCRRYWTRGGSLRNIPVGGGSRKNSKRSRPNNSSLPSSLLGGAQQENPFLGLGGYGLAPGLNGLGFGSWPAIGGEADGSSSDDQVLVPSSGLNSWQVGEEVMNDDGDCFGWPELAISTPGTPRFEPTFWLANSTSSTTHSRYSLDI